MRGAFIPVVALAIGGTVFSAMAQVPWGPCCEMDQWPMEPGMRGSVPRHHFALRSGFPGAYRRASNPLPRTRETVERGAKVYEANCASCHGATGAGDGEAGRNLSPPPGNLAWLSQVPLVQWDPFMYWTVAEGGTRFKTAMPAFKDTLSQDDIWAVIAYIQAQLPQTAK